MSSTAQPADPTFGGLIDPGRLESWLRDTVGADGPMSVQHASTGHTNEMFLVQIGAEKWIVRRPPKHKADRSASNMAREYRVLSALEGTDVPHARAVALCEDTDVIGSQFLVMEFVEGFKGLPRHAPPQFADVAARRKVAFALIEGLASVHRVDWQAQGLEGFGRPANFLERQVDRWMAQFERYDHRPLPHLDEVAQWLRDARPEQARIGLMHGDYSGGNVLIAFDRPARLAAIIDWENSTIGDPLLDLASFLRPWPKNPGEIRPPENATNVRYSDLEGVPTQSELRQRWEELTGLSAPDLTYYEVLGRFRTAIVLEGSYTRYVRGLSSDPYHETFGERVPQLLQGAANLIAARSAAP